MEGIHRDGIRKSWTSIINNLSSENVSYITDFLVSNNILTLSMKEEIECEKLTSSKTRRLLTIIVRRGPKAFQALIESFLFNNLSHIADIVLSNVEENVPEHSRVINTLTTPYNTSLQNNIVQDRTSSSTVNRSGGPSTNDLCQCNICFENRITIALDPCGHTLCRVCSENIRNTRMCCYCRQHIRNFITIYIN